MVLNMHGLEKAFGAYRENARHVWNSFLLSGNKLDFDTIDEFRDVERTLFTAYVLRPLDRLSRAKDFRNGPLSFIVVTPDKGVSGGVPILVNRPSQDGAKYWDEKIDRATHDDLKMAFVDLFDFNTRGLADLKYVMCQITKFRSRPEFEGRKALIEFGHATIQYDINAT